MYERERERKCVCVCVEICLCTFQVVKVVREREVEAARASMKAVSSIHGYSVQKSALPDVGLLYGANYDVMKQHLNNISRFVCMCVYPVIFTLF